MAMSNEAFYPTTLITPVEGLVHGWRKTVKITTSGGKVIKCTMGKGPMLEDSEFETESSLVL